jgi:hypothetical protein
MTVMMKCSFTTHKERMAKPHGTGRSWTRTQLSQAAFPLAWTQQGGQITAGLRLSSCCPKLSKGQRLSRSGTCAFTSASTLGRSPLRAACAATAPTMLAPCVSMSAPTPARSTLRAACAIIGPAMPAPCGPMSAPTLGRSPLGLCVQHVHLQLQPCQHHAGP